MKKQRSTEFLIYYTSIAIFQIYAIFSIFKLCNEANNKNLLEGMHKGYIFGRDIDLSDAQQNNFRSGLPSLILTMSSFSILTFILRSYLKIKKDILLQFQLTFSIIYLFVLHGFSVFFIFIFLLMNFSISYYFNKSRLNIVITQIFNIFVLFFIEYYNGFKFKTIFGSYLPFLDNFNGIFPQHFIFNLSSLRMISYNTDYYQFLNNKKIFNSSGKEITFFDHKVSCDICSKYEPFLDQCYQQREKTSLDSEKYSILRYFVYVLFAPLYLSGPIITFNAFTSYFEKKQQTYDFQNLLKYAFVIILEFILFEIILHFIYPQSLLNSQNSHGQCIQMSGEFSITSITIISYFLLICLQLKFLLIQKFFRFQSLVNGIETLENMNRCVNNNYSVQGFQHSWHSSFNKWIIRYIYIPLGGSTNPIIFRGFTILIIFVFVALQHDFKLKLVIQGLLMGFFLIIELPILSFINSFTLKKFVGETFSRILKGLFAVQTILILMLSNLIGFGGGHKDINKLLSMIFSTNIFKTLFILFTYLYSASQIMFELEKQKIQYIINF